MRHALKALACPLLICLCLSACNNKQQEDVAYDHVADDLRLPPPTLDFVPPTNDEPLPVSARQRVAWQRMFFQKDFARLDTELLASHRAYAEGREQVSGLRTLSTSLDQTELAGIDICRDWLAQMPSSYSAHFVCASMWQHGAWSARGGDYANKVSAIRFKLMDERFAQADDLFERAISLDPHPTEAISRRATVQFMLGNKAAADSLRTEALRLNPKDPNIHLSRIRFSLPEWGGSNEKAQAAYADAAAAGVDPISLAEMHDLFVFRSYLHLSDEKSIAYLQEALATQQTPGRLAEMVRIRQKMKDHEAAIQVATQLIEAYPDSSGAYYERAESEEALGMTAQALDDFKMAAALGNNYAMWHIFNAYNKGRLGVPEKSWPEMLAFCRQGAQLGLPSAASCMGAVLDGQTAQGTLLPKDMPHALAWHQLAARGGQRGSQYDLGWHIFSGDAPSLTPEEARLQGLFWMRRSAEQKLPLASQKLKELDVPEEESVGQNRFWLEALASVIQAIAGWR